MEDLRLYSKLEEYWMRVFTAAKNFTNVVAKIIAHVTAWLLALVTEHVRLFKLKPETVRLSTGPLEALNTENVCVYTNL